MNTYDQLRADANDDFYAEEEDGMWYVFGTESGFAYSSHCSQSEAEMEVDRQER